MRKQFFYEAEIEPGKTGWKSFNLDKVIFSDYHNGQWVIFLDDLRESPQMMQIPDAKTGKIKNEIRRVPVCTEITLKEEDYERFRKASEWI